jgi:hypothetical protein
MTPPAATAAGRTLTRPVAPRAPRRVSGPAARPRRGADGRAGQGRRAPAPAAADPFILRALHRTRALADSRFLDRLIRGRLWIPIVAAGLMGIVFMQVSMLKLNAGIGRAVQSAATLERQNTGLRAAVSGMESGTRIDAAARHLGMVVPADGSTHYVTAAARGLATAAAHRMTAAGAEAIARSKVATTLSAGQAPTGAALAAAGVVAATAVTQTAAAAPATTATAPAAAAPTGTTATAPVTPAATVPTTQQTTTPPPASQQTAGATTAPVTQQSQTPASTQQPSATPTAASTSGGAVAPPQG